MEEGLSNDIKPTLNLDGGCVELTDISGNVITVKLLGMCGGCMNAAATLKGFVEKTLREKLSADIEVKQA